MTKRPTFRQAGIIQYDRRDAAGKTVDNGGFDLYISRLSFA